ncbi:MAG: Lead, cadmium, zinc and mercury transporting ATPase, partial [Myxococcaceae bacterium]|nr:Lead, cadmium, zinc and mercury transporting ATPase [Myxococcaceae bacterium]
MLAEPSFERGVRDASDPMPYEPSVPCAACARGVDPLRAACVSITETSVHYFCTRRCRESYVASEAAHQQTVARTTEPRALAVPSESAPSLGPTGASFEQVARRVAPAEPSTPLWPLLASPIFALLGTLPVRSFDQLGALGLIGVAAVFTSRATLTREHGSLFGWLAAPIGVSLFSLASLLGQDAPELLGAMGQPAACLFSAVVGVLIMWLREHWLERERATQIALRTELSARLSPRVRVSTAPPASSLAPHEVRRASASPQLSERKLEQVAIGDEVVLDSGTVAPVDGVVVSGFGEVLPYPRARVPVQRQRGQVVLAGALLTQGSLRIRASAVGDQRALFRVFAEGGSEPDERGPGTGQLALASAAERMEHGMQLSLLAVALAFFGPVGVAAKLSGLAAALLAAPAVALARGIRGAYQRAIVSGSARGVHYREPASIERAGSVDTAVLRVEGPLVSRSYTLLEVFSLSEAHDARALLALALAAELADESHGIARAVREHAESLGVEPASLRRLMPARGRGISALTDGQGTLVFGSRAALLQAGVSVAVADREAQRAELLGQRVVFLALGGRARGLFVFAQTVQPEARVALQTLFDLGLEVELVSGDHRPTVEAIARTLDITQVKAELSSEQRAAEVRRLREGEARVVAIGHIPEDRALLAAADLSLSLDAASPAGEHDVVYDITTASPDLRDAAAALGLARRVRREVRLALFASGLSGGLGLLSAFGAVPPLLFHFLALTVDWLCLARPGWGFAAGTRT